MAFSRVTDFTSGKFTQVNFRGKVTDNNKKCHKQNLWWFEGLFYQRDLEAEFWTLQVQCMHEFANGTASYKNPENGLKNVQGFLQKFSKNLRFHL